MICVKQAPRTKSTTTGKQHPFLNKARAPFLARAMLCNQFVVVAFVNVIRGCFHQDWMRKHEGELRLGSVTRYVRDPVALISTKRKKLMQGWGRCRITRSASALQSPIICFGRSTVFYSGK